MKRIALGFLLAAGLAAPAFGQGAPAPASRVRGTVVSLSGSTLTVAGITGAPTVITLAPGYRVSYYVKSSFDKIPAGSYIGAASEPLPDGTLKAIAVQIFPPGFKPGPGTRPWDLTPTSMMTNATVDTIAETKVDKADGHVLSVSYEGGEKKIIITPATSIVGVAPADASAIVPGAHVLVFVTKGADGALTGTNVGVGKDGLTPPL
jgi:hypothetical protein